MEKEWSPMPVSYPYQLTVKVCVVFQSYFLIALQSVDQEHLEICGVIMVMYGASRSRRLSPCCLAIRSWSDKGRLWFKNQSHWQHISKEDNLQKWMQELRQAIDTAKVTWLLHHEGFLVKYVPVWHFLLWASCQNTLVALSLEWFWCYQKVCIVADISIFWEITQHFLNLKTCFDRNFCHLQFKLQSTELNI